MHKKYNIFFCVKNNTNHLNLTTQRDIFRNVFLNSKTFCNNVNIFCLPEIEEISHIKWKIIFSDLQDIFANSKINITIRRGLVQQSLISIRHVLIPEAHDNSLEGHKGITKTNLQFRLDCYWNKIVKSRTRLYWPIIKMQTKKTNQNKDKTTQ